MPAALLSSETSCSTSANEALAQGIFRMPINPDVQHDEAHFSDTLILPAPMGDGPPRRRRGRPPSRPPSHTPTKDQTATKKKNRARKRRTTAAHKRWQEEFREKIMQDSDLYNRILRYEVHMIINFFIRLRS